MYQFKRSRIIGFTLILNLVIAIWLLTSLSTQAAPPETGNLIYKTVTALKAVEDNSSLLFDPPNGNGSPLTTPCGNGTLPPEETLCLYGTVWWQPTNGEVQALANIPITISRGSQIITGTTFLHPGKAQPTYELDILPLGLAFLEPVTVSAHISGSTITQQLLVYPDFSSHSQQFDIWAYEVGALSGDIFGYVVDFAAGGPVTDALVTVEVNSNGTIDLFSTTTAVTPPETTPGYQLELLGASAGDLLTVTATYSGNQARRSAVLGSSPLQINLVTGWMCPDFNPIPDPSGGGGIGSLPDPIPDPSGGGGIPDVACFWGTVTVDGQPVSGATVYLETDAFTYAGQTTLYPGETEPRYGIGIIEGQAISNSVITMTAVYNSLSVQQAVTVSLDNYLSQRVDFSLNSTAPLANLTTRRDTQTMIWNNDGKYLPPPTAIWPTTASIPSLSTMELNGSAWAQKARPAAFLSLMIRTTNGSIFRLLPGNSAT